MRRLSRAVLALLRLERAPLLPVVSFEETEETESQLLGAVVSRFDAGVDVALRGPVRQSAECTALPI